MLSSVYCKYMCNAPVKDQGNRAASIGLYGSWWRVLHQNTVSWEWFINIPYWREMGTTCNERRVCFLNSDPFVVRTYGDDSFEIMQAARILLDGLLMDNVAEKLKCKHEWLNRWTVRRMKKTIADFQTESGQPSNSNRTGTILICACSRYLAFPRIYLIRSSDLAQRPRPLFRLVSHIRGDIGGLHTLGQDPMLLGVADTSEAAVRVFLH
jgi:hypothetical protein